MNIIISTISFLILNVFCVALFLITCNLSILSVSDQERVITHKSPLRRFKVQIIQVM